MLFDDEESMEKKRDLAQGLGISKFFLLYPEVEDFLPRLVGNEGEAQIRAESGADIPLPTGIPHRPLISQLR